MKLVAVGVSFRTADVALRERIAFTSRQQQTATADLAARYGCESAIVSTCNRVELYLARPAGGELPDASLLSEFLGEHHRVDSASLRPHLVERGGSEAVRHLFRVAASLDSLIVGEAQIVGQVKTSLESARKLGTTGPVLNALFQHAQKAAKRVRTETGIAQGHVSVSSVAVDYVRQVFDHFGDKTVLVVGAGKMGRLTLKSLQHLQPRRILVANRSSERAAEVAAGCGGTAVGWESLDEALVDADIVLSTTGSQDPVVSARRYSAIRQRRGGRPTVILDIAVPRDFDPAIHDGDTTFVFNIDDLKSVREQTLALRRAHLDRSEAIVEEETRRFLDDWDRRKHGQLIARLTEEFESKRREVLGPLMERLNGKLTEKDWQDIEGAFRLYQNRLLHGPITALGDSGREAHGSTLSEAIRRLFRLD